MPESVTDSGHDSNSTFESNTHTDVSRQSGGLGQFPREKDYNQPVELLPQLPSHKFKHSVWYDLRQTTLTGDSLHAPRIRKGPPECEKEFHKLEQEGIPIHHERRGRTRQNYQNTHENWEQAQAINLSYQELMDEYQKKNFLRVLQRCQSAVTVNLVNNCMEDFSSVKFQSCEYLNLNNNFLKSFNRMSTNCQTHQQDFTGQPVLCRWLSKSLWGKEKLLKNFPSLPRVKSVTASFNAVNSFKGLSNLSSSPIVELNLEGNPIFFEVNYRQKVFETLPHLQMLDGIPRLPSDSVFQEEPLPIKGQDPGCNIL